LALVEVTSGSSPGAEFYYGIDGGMIAPDGKVATVPFALETGDTVRWVNPARQAPSGGDRSTPESRRPGRRPWLPSRATLRPEQMQQRVCTNHLVGGGEQRWRHGTLACTSNQPVGATPGNRTHDLSDRFCCKSGRPNYRPRNGRQAEIAALIRRAVLAARNT
jgi:hypothetical protein